MTKVIATTEALEAFCAPLHEAEFITVDTEFMRERSYWSKLCLIQVAGPKDAAVIDPMAEGISLAPLLAVLENQKVAKVFHAARQDLEIFYKIMGKLPSPVYDTQVMASVAGFGESASYETLVASLANAKIDKSSRFTDWGRRPLSDKQLAYALDDVTHLRVIYEKLLQTLHKKHRTAWIDREMATLTDPALYTVNPDEMWQRLKFRTNDPRTNTLVKELAAWRERTAQNLDIPRVRVMRDEALLEMAYHPSTDIEKMRGIRGLAHGFCDGPLAEQVIKIIESVKALPNDQLLVINTQRTSNNPTTTATVDLLRVLLKHVADKNGVAPGLIARSDDLDALALAGEGADLPVLTGWRYDVFGRHALALKRGRLGFTLNGHKLVLLDMDPGAPLTV